MKHKVRAYLNKVLHKKLYSLAVKSTHRQLAAWGLECAKRVLPYFEKKHPHDQRPRLAIKAGRQWLRTGVFSMSVIRKASLAAHAAARRARKGTPEQFAARAAGQAVAAAHARLHGVAAAVYAIKTFAAAGKATKGEGAFQHRRLMLLRGMKKYK